MKSFRLSIAMVGMLALGGPVWANVGDQVVDGTIPAGTATVDGDLSDWSGAVWNKIDQFFLGAPINLDPDWDPEWTARWDGNTIYAAVRVIDNTPFHSDAYLTFESSDQLEVFSRGSGTAGSPSPFYATTSVGYGPAQHYFVGIQDTTLDSGGGDSWGALGPAEFPGSFPETRLLVNDGSDSLTLATSATGIVGGTHTLIYEMAVKQYNTFDEADPTTGLRTLAVGDQVGFAIAADTKSSASFAGTVSAGGTGGMFENFDKIGLYELVAAATTSGDFDGDDDVDGFDFLKWQRGESPSPLSGLDLANWEANYGTNGGTLAVSVRAVPEPSTVCLLLMITLLGTLARF